MGGGEVDRDRCLWNAPPPAELSSARNPTLSAHVHNGTDAHVDDLRELIGGENLHAHPPRLLTALDSATSRTARMFGLTVSRSSSAISLSTCRITRARRRREWRSSATAREMAPARKERRWVTRSPATR